MQRGNMKTFQVSTLSLTRVFLVRGLIGENEFRVKEDQDCEPDEGDSDDGGDQSHQEREMRNETHHPSQNGKGDRDHSLL